MYSFISWPEVRKGGGAFAYYSQTRGCERYIRMVSDSNGCAPMHIRIHAACIPKAGAPANAAQAATAMMVKTRAFVDWIVPPSQPWTENEVVRSPDLLPVVAEMCRLVGWTRGSPLLLLFLNMATSDALSELPGYDEHIKSGNDTHGWVRSTYLSDEHDSLIVLE